MEFEDKQTSPPSDPTEKVGPNTQFLQSMGFGEEELRSLDANSEEEIKGEVALSSLPDDMEVPGVESKPPAGPRVVGVQIGNRAHQVESNGRVEISRSHLNPGPETQEAFEDSSEEQASEPENQVEEAQDPVEEADPDLLHLHCPSCEEELVLRKEHVGVEGACVWCDTKIVAVRSGLEGEVKVFALEPIPAKTPETTEEDSSLDTSATEELQSESIESFSDAESEKEKAQEVDPSEEGVDSEKPALGELSDGFASGWGDAPEALASQEEEQKDSTKETEPAPAFAGWSGMDSPEPASASTEEPTEIPAGFGDLETGNEAPEPDPTADFSGGFSGWGEGPEAAAEAKPDAAVKEDAIPTALPGDEELAPVGFGDLDFSPESTEDTAPSESAVADGFAPSPFSGDTPPAPAEKGSLPEAPVGFNAAPTPMSPESPAQDPLETVFGSDFEKGDAVQEKSEEMPLASGWEGSIGSSDQPSIDLAPLPVPEEPFAAPTAVENLSSPEAPAISDGFGASSGFSMGETSAFADAAPQAEPSMESHPSPTAELKTESEVSPAFPNEEEMASSDGFQIPTSQPAGFGMEDAPPSSPIPVPETSSQAAPEPAGFADPFAVPVENKPTDAAPQESPFFTDAAEPFSPASDSASADSLFSESPAETASPFSDSPATESAPSPFSESSFAEAPSSPFGEAAPSPFTETPAQVPPTLPGGDTSPNEAPETQASPTPAPGQADSEPSSLAGEKKRSKKKGPRKGLVIFLVVLIGFVCGAALASFVLPVDQYIVEARAFMEQKFNPEGAVLNQDLLLPGTTPGGPANEPQP